jgi:shikimate dehydrogenase
MIDEGNMTEPKMYAEVIGDPISQSKSPTIHNFWLNKLNFDAQYHAKKVTKPCLADYLSKRRDDPNWVGCNVTMPLKELVLDQLDVIDSRAAGVGAVNTIYKNHKKELVGTNTDVDGFLEPLSDLLADNHYFRMARVIGTGGAARAIVSALAPWGFSIVLAGRDHSKAAEILDALKPAGEHYAVKLTHYSEPTDFEFDDREGCLDLIINASPLGMEGQPTLHFDWSHAPPGSVVYDIVTNPLETPFLKSAKTKGFKVIDGLSMLVGQAAHAFNHFFGVPAPRQFDSDLRFVLTK